MSKYEIVRDFLIECEKVAKAADPGAHTMTVVIKRYQAEALVGMALYGRTLLEWMVSAISDGVGVPPIANAPFADETPSSPMPQVEEQSWEVCGFDVLAAAAGAPANEQIQAGLDKAAAYLRLKACDRIVSKFGQEPSITDVSTARMYTALAIDIEALAHR